jgi:AcrR family transcriptional regulator
LPGGKRDRARRANQQALCDAGLELFLAEGTAAVTIDQIVTAAGMAKGSFYRYATDKADLIEQIMAPVVHETTGALQRCEHALRDAKRATLAAVYTRLAGELAQVVARHAPRVRLYLQEARAPASAPRRAIHALSTQLTARTVALTEVAVRRGLIRDVDPEIAALTVLGAVEAMLFAFLRRRPGGTQDIPTVIRELVTIVLAGISRRSDRSPQRTTRKRRAP